MFSLRVLACLGLSLSFVGAAPAPISIPGIVYTNITKGLDYGLVRETNQPWSIHIARLDRRQKGFEVFTTHGKGRIHALEGLSSQVAAFPAKEGQPRVAINGDFFAIRPGPYQGDPEGLQIVNRELISAPLDKCFWIERNGEPRIGEIVSRFTVTWPTGSKTRLYLNQAPVTNCATLFTPVFGTSTEATNETEIVLEKVGWGRWLPLRVDETYRARVREVRSAGNTTLSSNQMVLTVTGTARTNLSGLKRGDIVTLKTTTSVDISGATAAVGGGPVLVSNGKEQEWPARKGGSDYLQPRHPRTAIGYDSKYVYFVVVDGRQKELSMGMSFVELASLMKQIGCTEALNLDGGGSTTFWLDGKVMNSPSDKRERSLANAVLVVQRRR